MKNKKKNNKGFSLVELIVVVLIMAIIGVALAPQVTKWVGNSRQAADQQSYEGMLANIQLALINNAAYTELKAEDEVKVKIANTGTTVDPNGLTAFEGAMDKLDGSWKSIKSKVSGEEYFITIKNGVIAAPSDTDVPVLGEDFK